MIKANSNLIISSSNSKIAVNDSDIVEFLYPNGSLAISWQKPITQLAPREVLIKEESLAPEVKPEIKIKESQPAENQPVEEQTANVMTITENKGFLESKNFLFLVIGRGIIGAVGLLFLSHKYRDGEE